MDFYISQQQLQFDYKIVCRLSPVHNRIQPQVHNRIQPPVHNRIQPPVHNRIQPPVHNRIQPPVHNRIQPPVHNIQPPNGLHKVPLVREEAGKKKEMPAGMDILPSVQVTGNERTDIYIIFAIMLYPCKSHGTDAI